MEFDFKIRGKIKPKQSAKFAKVNNFIKSYQPQEVIEYSNWVKLCFQKEYPDALPLDSAVQCHITVCFEVPKSYSNKKYTACLENRVCPTVKPDWDNCAKQICDSLNGLAYLDDRQIVWGTVRKKYATESYVRVEIGKYE